MPLDPDKYKWKQLKRKLTKICRKLHYFSIIRAHPYASFLIRVTKRMFKPSNQLYMRKEVLPNYPE